MSNEFPLVSVLIPAYNHENYIQETIKSIINQTYQNIELIIVDDGSKDSTWQKIQDLREQCENRFVRVYFETKENEGTCSTLNKLLNLAQGKYVYIIASDDCAKPNAIAEEINFLEKNSEYALVVGDNEIIDSEGSIGYWDDERNLVKTKQAASFISFCDFLQKKKRFSFSSNIFGTYQSLFLMGNYIPNGYLIRKEIFQKTGFFTPEAPLEDYYLMLQISKYAKMKYLNQILFSYRWHDSNTVRNVSKMVSYTEQTLKHEEQILENINEKEVLKEVKLIKKEGFCYKKRGIPFIFEILSYKKSDRKTKAIKLLGIIVAKWFIEK